MRLRKTVGLYEEMPRGYEFSHYNHTTRQFVCYPIGLHLLTALCVRLYQRWIMLSPSRFDRYIMSVAAKVRAETLATREADTTNLTPPKAVEIVQDKTMRHVTNGFGAFQSVSHAHRGF